MQKKKDGVSAFGDASTSLHQAMEFFAHWLEPQIALGFLANLKETHEVLQKHVLSWGYKLVIGVKVVIPKMEIGYYET